MREISSAPGSPYTVVLFFMDAYRGLRERRGVGYVESYEALSRALEEAQLVLEAVTSGEYCCLRHGLPYVTPSLLAEQAFCEARLHYRLERGDSSPPARASIARELLQVLLRVRRRLTVEDAVKGVYTSIPIAAIVNRVPIVARPPAILVEKGCARRIYLAKKSRQLRLYASDIVKGYAYGVVLERIGLACQVLEIVYTVAHTERTLVAGLLKGPEPGSGDVRVIKRVYDSYEAERVLEPLLAYWRGEKPPQPRPGSYCSNCPYRSMCATLP